MFGMGRMMRQQANGQPGANGMFFYCLVFIKKKEKELDDVNLMCVFFLFVCFLNI